MAVRVCTENQSAWTGGANMPEHSAFLPKGVNPSENQLTELTVRDSDTLETHRVRAIITRSQEGAPGAEKLWLQDNEAVAVRAENPWWIQILEILDEEREEVTVLPKPSVSLGKRRGGMLRHLIERSEGQGAGEDEE